MKLSTNGKISVIVRTKGLILRLTATEDASFYNFIKETFPWTKYFLERVKNKDNWYLEATFIKASHPKEEGGPINKDPKLDMTSLGYSYICLFRNINLKIIEKEPEEFSGAIAHYHKYLTEDFIVNILTNRNGPYNSLMVKSNIWTILNRKDLRLSKETETYLKMLSF